MASRVLAPPPGDLLAPSLEDWQWLVHASRPNGLVVGPESFVARILMACGKLLRQPVVHWPRDGAPWHREQQLSTLVLHEVGTLAHEEQDALLQWMGGAGRGVQVLSLASSRVFPLVEQGAFLETLYYRLNCVLIECAPYSLTSRETIDPRNRF
jgi:hypothetical protein